MPLRRPSCVRSSLDAATSPVLRTQQPSCRYVARLAYAAAFMPLRPFVVAAALRARSEAAGALHEQHSSARSR